MATTTVLHACSLRNSTLTPVVVTYHDTLIFIKPKSTMVSPHACDGVLKGMLYASRVTLTPENISRKGTDSAMTITPEGVVVAENGVFSAITNQTQNHVIVYGEAGKSVLPITLLLPSHSVDIQGNVADGLKLTVISGRYFFAVQAPQLQHLKNNHEAVVPLAAYRTKDNMLHTYGLTWGQTYDKKETISQMLDIISSDASALQTLPELQRCETLPSVQMNASYRAAIICILVFVLLTFVLFVVLIVLLSKRAIIRK